MINNYDKKIANLTRWDEHVFFWTKVLNRLRTDKTIEQLITETEKYYFVTNKNMKLFNGKKMVKHYENPYLYSLIKLDYKLNYFSKNKAVIDKYSKLLRLSVLNVGKLRIAPIVLLDYFYSEIKWDYYTIAFTFAGKEYDETIRKTFIKYNTEIFNVVAYQPHLKILLILRKISVGLFSRIEDIRNVLMIEPNELFLNEDLINIIIDYILHDEFDLSILREKYFGNAHDFLNEHEFRNMFDKIKSDDELSLYLVAQ